VNHSKAGVCIVLGLFLVSLAPQNLSAYIVRYKEQFYRLYHTHYIQYPDDSIENIRWLEQALKADFANPLNAVALIENEIQWEKYRYLFMMHLNLKMIEQYVQLGNKWNKRNAYFYNAPWREQNLKSLETAETCFRIALIYWQDAVAWSVKAREPRFRYIDLERVGYWQEEAVRIERKTLDYEKTLTRELEKLRQVREQFQAMDEDTY
jgi:hypothetical protein